MTFFRNKIIRNISIGIVGLLAIQLAIVLTLAPGALLIYSLGLVDLKSLFPSTSSLQSNAAGKLNTSSKDSNFAHFLKSFSPAPTSATLGFSLPEPKPQNTHFATAIAEMDSILDRLSLDSSAKAHFFDLIARKGALDDDNTDRVAASAIAPLLETPTIAPKYITNPRKSIASTVFSVFFASVSYIGLGVLFFLWSSDQKKELRNLRYLITNSLALDVSRLSTEVALISKASLPDGLDVLRNDLSALQKDVETIINNQHEQETSQMKKDSFASVTSKYLDLREKFSRYTLALSPDVSSSPSLSSASPLTECTTDKSQEEFQVEPSVPATNDTLETSADAPVASISMDKPEEPQSSKVVDPEGNIQKALDPSNLQASQDTNTRNFQMTNTNNKTRYSTIHQSHLNPSASSPFYSHTNPSLGKYHPGYRASSVRTAASVQRTTFQHYAPHGTGYKLTRLSPNSASVIKTLNTGGSLLAPSPAEPKQIRTADFEKFGRREGQDSRASSGLKESLWGQAENTARLSDKSSAVKRKLLKTEFGTFDISTESGRKEWIRAMNDFNNKPASLPSSGEISSAPIVLSGRSISQQIFGEAPLSGELSSGALDSADSGCESARIEFIIPKNTRMNATTLVASLSPAEEPATAVDLSKAEESTSAGSVTEELQGSTAVEESNGGDIDGKVQLLIAEESGNDDLAGKASDLGVADDKAGDEVERVVLTLEDIKAKLEESEIKNYRRLFLPGRGWVSAKKLQEEAIVMESQAAGKECQV